jgi:microcystin-dependent protein
MPDDVSGNYSLPPSYFVQDGDTVLPEQHNPPFEDVASALSNRLHKDGRTLWTGNQNANGNKLIGLADGVGLQDAATVKQAVAASTPIGSVVDYAGVSAPTNWLFCFGQAISRTTYASLFAVMGTAWGVGDGSTTFNLPDCRGRASVGKDDMGGTAANRITTAGAGFDGKTLAAAGGSQTHTLTTAQLPSHTHPAAAASNGAHTHTGTAASNGAHTHTGTAASAGAHAHTASTATSGAHTHSGVTDGTGDHVHAGGLSTDGDHQHTYNAPQATIFFGGSGGQNIPSIAGASTGVAGSHSHTVFISGAGAHAHAYTTPSAGGHTHTVTVDSSGAHTHTVATDSAGAHTHDVTTVSAGAHTHTITVDNTGSGAAHLNVQPSVVFNKIIRVA